MTTKQKEKIKDVIIRKEDRTDERNKYTYLLIMNESSNVASYGIPLYSVRVELTDETGRISSAEIRDVFADAGRAIVFFDKLVRNLATPIDLTYILEDEIS